jgi:carbamoylphosphate synthase large subunit
MALNVQVLHTEAGELKVIETNVRASRSLPFSAKVSADSTACQQLVQHVSS